MGSDKTKLVHKLKNIQLEYEMIPSKSLVDEATGVYSLGKEFLYDYVDGCGYHCERVGDEQHDAG